MNGLVSLVHQQCMPDVAQEAMEVKKKIKQSKCEKEMFYVSQILHPPPQKKKLYNLIKIKTKHNPSVL